MLVGAQAIYLYTGDADVAIATTTKDSDIALIPVRLTPEPTLDAAMTAAGFSHDRSVQWPGEWSSVEEFDPPVERSCRRNSTQAAAVAAHGSPRTPNTRRALCPVSKWRR